MTAMSQIKTEHFSLPWRLHLPPRPSCICTPLCQNVILCLAPSLSPRRKVGHRHEGALLAPSPNTGIKGCCEHEGAVPAFDRWIVCQ